MNSITRLSLLLLALLAAGWAIAQQPTPVKVETGLVQGTAAEGLTIYRGIPFAAPPVGDLRWRAPQPAAKWEGVKQTTRFAPKPIQGASNAPDTSEDGLSRNRNRNGIARLRDTVFARSHSQQLRFRASGSVQQLSAPSKSCVTRAPA